VFHARTRSVMQFRPIKKRQSRPRGKPTRKIAAFHPIPLTTAGQHIPTEALPSAFTKHKGEILPRGLQTHFTRGACNGQ
jgi:hypothetical protein